MMVNSRILCFLVTLVAFSLLGATLQHAVAESVPEWIKNTAKWYGEGKISEEEFVNAIKYLIDNNIIVLESGQKKTVSKTGQSFETIIISNGNSYTVVITSKQKFNIENYRHTIKLKQIFCKSEMNALPLRCRFTTIYIQDGSGYPFGFVGCQKYGSV